MDASTHLLTLKVMRVSRPGMASSWQPFFTSSPSFSAHATESILSLQGQTPLPGYPKTLRDLTHASQLLTLPSAFGAIQLGETFASCLCINNDANVDVEGVFLRVEIQTATNKVILAEIGGPEQRLAPAGILETVVNHEMKELGQHVLACHVSYRLPTSVLHSSSVGGETAESSVQTFRKFYKFVVTNPLSVRTKVHTPRSPSSLLSWAEREKVFLEIHVQNMTRDPMWFERIHFEAIDTWNVTDANISQNGGQNIFSGSVDIFHPEDIRQYVYILTPKSVPSLPTTYQPGTVIPLGRLDLSWRSSFGEPGRLLTSLLTRKIPIHNSQPSVPHPSAIPPRLQSPRPHSPQHVSSRPSSPPGSASAFKPRPPSQIVRPQSPASILTSSPGTVPTLPDLTVDLTIESLPTSHVPLDRPFSAKFKLTVSALVPPSSHVRLIHLAVQPLQSPRVAPVLKPTPPPDLPTSRSTSARPSIDTVSSIPYAARTVPSRQEVDGALESASPTKSPKRGIFNFGQSLSQPLTESPSGRYTPKGSIQSLAPMGSSAQVFNLMRFPSPFNATVTQRSTLPLGSSVIFLPPLQFSAEPITPKPDGSSTGQGARQEQSVVFEYAMLPIRKGFTTIGGLRTLLIEDREMDGSIEDDNLILMVHSNAEATILHEWDVVGEVWITD